MSREVFVDSNVFVYASDAENPDKQAAARSHLLQIQSTGAAISTQILQGVANTVLRRGRLAPEKVLGLVEEMIDGFRVITIEPDDVVEAVRLRERTSISLWDALVVMAAKKAGCDQLLTEDLNAGQIIEGVRVVSPFTATA